MLGCEGLGHLAWKDPRPLNSWKVSWCGEEEEEVEGGLRVAQEQTSRADVLSPRLRTGSANHPGVICAS